MDRYGSHSERLHILFHKLFVIVEAPEAPAETIIITPILYRRAIHTIITNYYHIGKGQSPLVILFFNGL